METLSYHDFRGFVEAAKKISDWRLIEGADRLTDAAARRAGNPDLLAGTDEERADDAAIATLAATVSLRRHARGKDLRGVRLVVGSGGILRYAEPVTGRGVLAAVLADHPGGWPLPRAAVSIVDREYVLAPAGLLAADHPQAAIGLLRRVMPAMSI